MRFPRLNRARKTPSRRALEKEPMGSVGPNFRHPDPATDAALDWCLRLEAAPLDDEAARALRDWLEADPAHGARLDSLLRMMASPELATASAGLARALAAPRAARDRRAGGLRLGRACKAGLALAAIAALVVALNALPHWLLLWRADHLTGLAERAEIALPDGSTLVLNAQSAVALDFAQGRREVTLLAGEAFFRVRPDPAHPFLVHARHAETRVTGTEFAVSRSGPLDRVVLREGRVEVSTTAAASPAQSLAPGEAITASASGLSAVRPTDPAADLAWLDGRISFSDRPLSEVIDALQSYSPERLFIASSRLRRLQVSGNFRLDQPEAAIEALALAAGANLLRLPGGMFILN
ncbi:FecR family protein [Paracoccus aminophilus]|uniref:Anti-FecI sigma factor n=1 Tax=Paracoccus aminophilus JCM 7686 TaxID=1367847 RepID=S5XNL0_PARAH|nr:FecR domain-containing protein [Paracoccus aminophilus]AGT08914.1 anti-FecI sigma factor [Paracoccus aminophilus JCM 7686]